MRKPNVPTAAVAPYSLPLDEREFEQALSVGHGRAWLHLSQHGIGTVRGIVKNALLHSLAYDTQCEGDRSQWMIGMIDEAGAGRDLYPEFIEHAHDAPVDDHDFWHLSQRGTLLGTLASRGLDGARAALDRLFHEGRKQHPNELLGALDIIKVNGDKGLLQVCAVLGNEAHENSDDTVDDWFLNDFDEDRGDSAAVKVLQAERHHSQGIDRYLSTRETMLAARQADKQAKTRTSQLDETTPKISDYAKVPRAFHNLPVEKVIDWVRDAPQIEGQFPSSVEGRGWLRRWGIKANETALEEVLSTLDKTDSAIEQRRYLSIFSGRPMPQVSDRVVQLAESGDERVRSRAYAALKNVSDPRVRAVGLRSLIPERIKNGALELLQSSYALGDHEAIEAALIVPDDADDLHSVVFDLADVCATAKHPECLALMLFVYEYSPCGNCRGKVVATMAELGVAPTWLSDEGRFDAMEDIRGRFGGPRLED